MKYTVSFLFFVLICFSVDAQSASRDEFSYLAASINKPSYDDLDFTPQLATADLAPLKESSNKENIGLRLFYGYQFNRFVAVEAGLNYYGKSASSLYSETTDDKNVTTRTTKHKASLSSLGTDIRLIGTLPITNNLYLKASAGALGWFSDREFIIKKSDEFSVSKESDSGVSLVTGVGLVYGFGKFAAVSLDYEKTEIGGFDTTNIGLSFTFRL